MKLNCLIVDDEKLAQNVLEQYINKLPNLHLIAACSTALEAIAKLNEHAVDLIFLDINMPEISGMEMLRMLENRPKVIFTTAYSEFALESYDFGAVDYLLKPIPFDRFVKAVNRVLALGNNTKSTSPEPTETSVVLKQDGILYKVPFDAILYIQAFGNYINVYTTEKKLIVREKMHIIEKRIPSHLFARSHKSYFVFLNKISKIEGNQVFIGDVKIPIGSVHKMGLLKKFNDPSF